MKKIILAVKQRLAKQTLRRKPEKDLVMYDEEQDRQYTKDGEEGSLAILYDFMINSLLKVAPVQGRALDICCGSSQLLSKLARALPAIAFTGLDLSPHMLGFAKKSCKHNGVNNVNFQIGSMYELENIFDEKFDLITWHLALHHCETERQVIDVFNKISQLIKPNTTIFIFDIVRPKTGKFALQYADIFNARQGDWYYHDSLDSYKAAFTFDEMAKMLSISKLANYSHQQPWIGNFHQMIIISNTSNPNIKPVMNLKHLWQKIDYYLLKLTFFRFKHHSGSYHDK